MRRFGLPVAPAIIGVILGPIAEKQLRRAIAISDGDYSTLVSSPLAVGLYVVAAAILLGPVAARVLGRGGKDPDAAATEEEPEVLTSARS
jgi:putative tricarboxylic transport membrane protein